jgi:hypothetical protein
MVINIYYLYYFNVHKEIPSLAIGEAITFDMRAELIICDVSQEEYLRRLQMDIDRRYRQAEWVGYINKWFEEYVT